MKRAMRLLYEPIKNQPMPSIIKAACVTVCQYPAFRYKSILLNDQILSFCRGQSYLEGRQLITMHFYLLQPIDFYLISLTTCH